VSKLKRGALERQSEARKEQSVSSHNSTHREVLPIPDRTARVKHFETPGMGI
jgi:hypothetical protein